MATDSHISHLKAQLSEIDAEISRVQDHLHGGHDPDKAAALSELVQLRQRHDALADRIAESDEKGTRDWSALHESFQEDLDALKDTLARWLSRPN